MKAYKIIVPKPFENKDGNLQLLEVDTVISTDNDSEKASLDRLVSNGWAIEVKTVEPETADPAPKKEPKAKRKAPAKKKAPSKSKAEK
jgi:hypothetical protein